MKVCAHSSQVVSLEHGHLVAKAATRPATPTGGAPRPRRRLTAEARKSSILAAARRAFTETGDMTGTTIKVIAEHSGISEGVIYRHFESTLILALESHHSQKFDRDRAVTLISEGTVKGFFPTIQPTRRRS
jgi:Bacterial regulatory proteins, tetR family